MELLLKAENYEMTQGKLCVEWVTNSSVMKSLNVAIHKLQGYFPVKTLLFYSKISTSYHLLNSGVQDIEYNSSQHEKTASKQVARLHLEVTTARLVARFQLTSLEGDGDGAEAMMLRR